MACSKCAKKSKRNKAATVAQIARQNNINATTKQIISRATSNAKSVDVSKYKAEVDKLKT